MKVLHGERHPIVRLGVKVSLQDVWPNLQFFEADSYTIVLNELISKDYDLVLLDDSIPGGESFNMVARVRSIRSHIFVLILSESPEAIYGIHYLKVGADGFISKTCDFSDFIKAVSTVLSGRKYISAVQIEAVLTVSGHLPTYCPNPLLRLSTTELMIANMISKGVLMKEVANTLGLAPSTISFHKAQIFEKLNVSTPIELHEFMETHGR